MLAAICPVHAPVAELRLKIRAQSYKSYTSPVLLRRTVTVKAQLEAAGRVPERRNLLPRSRRCRRWRVHYNTVKPHSSLASRPPAPEAWLTPTIIWEWRAGNRNALLAEETELRRHSGARRRTPLRPSPGGGIPEDYTFEGHDGAVRIPQLFGDKDTHVHFVRLVFVVEDIRDGWAALHRPDLQPTLWEGAEQVDRVWHTAQASLHPSSLSCCRYD
jgi:hypothetical protein